MTRTRQAIVALAAAALLAGPAAAQQGQGRGQGQDVRGEWAGPGSRARNPVSMLLQRREDLGLTAEQVTRLEAIQTRVERENAPRIQQLRAVLGDRDPRELTTEERAELRERMRALDPVRDEIRQTNRAAMDEARAILTDEQQTRIRQVMRRRPGPDGRPGMRGPRRGPWQGAGQGGGPR